MAGTGSPVQELFEEATCSICLEYFRDPVIIPECGHNFCRSCLIQYWGGSQATKASCPECRKSVQPGSLIPNRSLANVAEKAMMFRGDFYGRKEGKGKVCQKHQEPLKLFCKEDQNPICVVCERSKDHKGHEVVPLEEVSQEYKNQICRCLDRLKEEREKIMALRMGTEKESQDLLNHMEAEMEKTVAEFRCLYQFLEEQEKRLLTQMEEVEKEITKKRKEHLVRLSEELSSLESLIQEVEMKLQEPADELLQDIESFLKRYQAKEKFEDPPMAFPPELKWKIWDFCDISPFLEGVMKQFRDSLGSGLQLQRESVTLDPDTAHPRLILSEDRKRVRFGDEDQDLSDSCERFDKHPYVLGSEGFTGGRHFWEVVVGREVGWAVGVARKSVKRKGQITFGPEEGIWGLGKWAGEYKASSHPPVTLSKEPERIRVTLNCEGGRVSFYDADTATLLHSFPEAAFSGETLQPLFWVPRKAHLILFD